jgi:hypothetical protein
MIISVKSDGGMSSYLQCLDAIYSVNR